MEGIWKWVGKPSHHNYYNNTKQNSNAQSNNNTITKPDGGHDMRPYI